LGFCGARAFAADVCADDLVECDVGQAVPDELLSGKA
jgi:hypothetical protein